MTLTDSGYKRGKNCHKALWLYINKQDTSSHEAEEKPKDREYTRCCKEYFANGKQATNELYATEESAQLTKELIAKGETTIYQAAFIYKDMSTIVDVLHKEGNSWRLYNKHASNSRKPEHDIEIAFQYFVVQGSGVVNVQDAFVMYLNRDYVRQDEIDVKKLFICESVIEDIVDMQPIIAQKAAELISVTKGNEPMVAMGEHCKKPYTCEWLEYCNELNGLTPEEKEPLAFRREPVINEVEIRKFVKSIQYPLTYLDFETIAPAVPMFNDSRPYQPITFQYSIHYQESETSEPKHTEYLADASYDIDPRHKLLVQMIKELDAAKTILVYNKTFEVSRIKELMRDFPTYQEPLASILEKIIDLANPFRKKYYYTESMQGKYSIKIVLPILCPDLSYSTLDIGDGLTASEKFLELYSIQDKEVIKKTREDLKKYCGLDTEAMVRIYDVLRKAID